MSQAVNGEDRQHGMDINNEKGDEDALASRNYIKWDDPSVEQIPEGEEEDIKAVADQINAIQKAQYNVHRHCYTGMQAVEIEISARSY